MTGRHLCETADIPLASRCLEKEARVIDPKGRTFTEDDIGERAVFIAASTQVSRRRQRARFMNVSPVGEDPADGASALSSARRSAGLPR
jgi:hypothetical protein